MKGEYVRITKGAKHLVGKFGIVMWEEESTPLRRYCISLDEGREWSTCRVEDVEPFKYTIDVPENWAGLNLSDLIPSWAAYRHGGGKPSEKCTFKALVLDTSTNILWEPLYLSAAYARAIPITFRKLNTSEPSWKTYQRWFDIKTGLIENG